MLESLSGTARKPYVDQHTKSLLSSEIVSLDPAIRLQSGSVVNRAGTPAFKPWFRQYSP